MRIVWRDLIATVLLAAIAVPYVGYLVRGDMPFIEDARGMAGAGLALALIVFLVLGIGDMNDPLGTPGAVAALGCLGLGVIALVVAETAAAEAVLAVFMVSIAAVWLMAVAQHRGVLPHWAHRG